MWLEMLIPGPQRGKLTTPTSSPQSTHAYTQPHGRRGVGPSREGRASGAITLPTTPQHSPFSPSPQCRALHVSEGAERGLRINEREWSVSRVGLAAQNCRTPK